MNEILDAYTDSPGGPDVELLTAYLDGELDETQREQLEQRLAIEPELRHELSALQQVDHLLEELPCPSARSQFTTTVIQMAALLETSQRDGRSPLEASSAFQAVLAADVPDPHLSPRSARDAETSTGASRAPRRIPLRRSWLLASAATTLAVAAGWFAGSVRWSQNQQRLDQQIVMAADLPALMVFEDYSILDELMNYESFDVLKQTDLARAVIPPPLEGDSPEQWVSRIDPQDKELLWLRLDELRRFTPENQDKITQQWHRLREASSSPAAGQVATIFAALLQSLPAKTQNLISAQRGTLLLESLRREADLKIAMWYPDHWSSSTRAEVRNWLFDTVQPAMAARGLTPTDIRDLTLFFFDSYAPEYGGDVTILFEQLKEHLERSLPSKLPWLSQTEQKDRVAVMMDWALAANGVTRGRIDQENLIDLYKERSDNADDSLDYLTRDAATHRLERQGRFSQIREQSKKDEL